MSMEEIDGITSSSAVDLLDDLMGDHLMQSEHIATDYANDRNGDTDDTGIALGLQEENLEESELLSPKQKQQLVPEDSLEEAEGNTASMVMMTPSRVVGRKSDGSRSAARVTNATTPLSARKNQGGLTMYERSMLQKEERERKMKALEETLMVDFTFTPSRISSGKKSRARTGSAESMVSSLASSPSTVGGASTTPGGGESVFSRLYAAGTTASRAQKHRTPTPNSNMYAFGSRTPTSAVASTAGRNSYSYSGNRSTITAQTASPRLESLFKSGEEKLRARNINNQDEAEQVRRRIENEAMSVCTFQPQTKWNLAAQRRKMAREAMEREADEARRATPKILKAVSSFCFCFLFVSILLK